MPCSDKAASDKTAKVIILFGAGASVDAGIPAMSGFVSDRLRPVARDAGMEAWLNDLLTDIAASCGDGPEDRENLEWLWSRLDLASHVGVPCVETRRAEFVRLAAKAFMPTSSCKHEQCAYAGLLRKLRDKIKKHLTDDSLAFISFNYDIALDRHLRSFGVEQYGWDSGSSEAWRRSLRYWIGRPYEQWQEGTEKLPKLLKLHGSLNWGVCEDEACGSGVTMREDFGELPDSLGKTHCNYHGEDTRRKLIPLIVPPSWLKAPHGHNLRRVWGRAQLELRRASALIVIGHSLPATDVYFRHFLGLAVGRRDREKGPLRFLVVDKSRPVAEKYACHLKRLGCKPADNGSGVIGEPFSYALDHIADLVSEFVVEDEGQTDPGTGSTP